MVYHCVVYIIYLIFKIKRPFPAVKGAPEVKSRVRGSAAFSETFRLVFTALARYLSLGNSQTNLRFHSVS